MYIRKLCVMSIISDRHSPDPGYILVIVTVYIPRRHNNQGTRSGRPLLTTDLCSACSGEPSDVPSPSSPGSGRPYPPHHVTSLRELAPNPRSPCCVKPRRAPAGSNLHVGLSRHGPGPTRPTLDVLPCMIAYSQRYRQEPVL